MDILLYAVKALHLISMATWFGHKLLLPGDVRRSLDAGAEAARLLVPRVDRMARIGLGAGVLTLLTGFGLVFLSGGFAGLPVRIHIGMTLAILIFAVSGALGRPAWKKARAAIARGDLDVARKRSKRLAMSTGIEHLLWTAALLTMVAKV